MGRRRNRHKPFNKYVTKLQNNTSSIVEKVTTSTQTDGKECSI